MALGQYLGAGSGVTKLLYRLNGDATDSSGNANDGTASNVTWANGRVGNQCGSFSSASSSNILSGSAVTLGDSQTIVVWFKTTTTGTNGTFLGSWLLGGATFMMGLNTPTTGTVRFLITDNDGSTQSATERGSGYNDGKWHKFIGTNDGSNQITYVDGVNLGSTNITINGINTSTPVAIGATRYSNSTTGNYITSEIDEVVLETGAWSPSSIKKDFTYSKGRFGIL